MTLGILAILYTCVHTGIDLETWIALSYTPRKIYKAYRGDVSLPKCGEGSHRPREPSQYVQNKMTGELRRGRERRALLTFYPCVVKIRKCFHVKRVTMLWFYHD